MKKHAVNDLTRLLEAIKESDAIVINDDIDAVLTEMLSMLGCREA